MFNRALISDTRFAIAFSGGGDSTALVHMLRRYNPLILIVDHNLRQGSREEAVATKAFAQSLGLETRILTWKHDNPKTGLQEKARKARYGLMGQVCREEGITHLLTGHTEDDQAETLLMRYDRGTDWRGAAGMQDRVYAPVWPELAEVFLVRPLLGVSRRALRAYNTELGLKWEEDPSNQNRNFTRIRARDYLNIHENMRRDLLATANDLQTGQSEERTRMRRFAEQHISVDGLGIVRTALTPPFHLLGLCVRVAAGTGGPLSKQSLHNLSVAMNSHTFSGATLGGAMVVRDKSRFAMGRDPSVAKGRANQAPLPEVHLSKGVSTIWDGRFKITSHVEGMPVKPYGTADFDRDMRDKLYKNVPHRLRLALPVVVDKSQSSRVDIQSLVAPRLQGILGLPSL